MAYRLNLKRPIDPKQEVCVCLCVYRQTHATKSLLAERTWVHGREISSCWTTSAAPATSILWPSQWRDLQSHRRSYTLPRTCATPLNIYISPKCILSNRIAFTLHSLFLKPRRLLKIAENKSVQLFPVHLYARHNRSAPRTSPFMLTPPSTPSR